MDDDVLARNNVKVSGRGTQPMLFAHGFGCDQNMWRFVAPAFEDDYRVVLFDYVGSGRSDLGAYDARRYASLEGYAQDVLDVCHALDLQDVVFVGHSVSGMIGVLAANRERERFARLVVVGRPPPAPSWAPSSNRASAPPIRSSPGASRRPPSSPTIAPMPPRSRFRRSSC